MSLPSDAKERKMMPIATGVLDYFGDAIAEVARVSRVGNDQHNGVGSLLHWDRTKSTDQADCIVRHLIERGKLDADGMRHTAKVAWRALALLQTELDDEAKARVETLNGCLVCGAAVRGDGEDHLRRKELDPAHAQALAKGPWQSLIAEAKS